MLEINSTEELYNFLVTYCMMKSPRASYPESVCAFVEEVIRAGKDLSGFPYAHAMVPLKTKGRPGDETAPNLVTALLGCDQSPRRPMPTLLVEFAVRVFEEIPERNTCINSAMHVLKAFDPSYLALVKSRHGFLIISREAFERKFGASMCVRVNEDPGFIFTPDQDEVVKLLTRMAATGRIWSVDAWLEAA